MLQPDGEQSSVPDLTDDIVEFTQSEDDWTNEDVVVYIDITDEDIQEDIDDGTYTLEYSTDGGETWEEYDPEEGITVDENTEVEVSLTDGTNTGGEVTHEVDNIDKTAPEVEIEVTDTTTNSITVEVTAEDLGDDGTSNSASGISSYEFQISTDGENWETIEIVETSEETYEYTYEGLIAGTTYYVRVIVTDVAGNSGASEAEEVSLDDVPGGDDDSGIYDEDGVSIPTITFEYSTTEWTNEDVTITVVVNGDAADLVEEGTYIVEYNTEDPTDEISWIEYTEEVVFETNGTIYVRLSDGTNTGDYATGNVTNIDKLAPTVDSVDSTSSSVTFTASDSSSSSYGASGIVGYYVGISSSEPDESDFVDCADEDGNGVANLEITVDELEQNTTYYIYVIDAAGNISSLSSETYVVTSEVPSLDDDNTSFTQDTDDWTNEDVTVYIDITDEDIQEDIDDGTYILEYSTDGGETWEEYDPEEGITVDENTEIEVRLSDGENTGGVVTHEVDNIDKTAPEVEIEVTDTTTNSITVEVTAEDLGDDGTSDSASGISSYEFQISTDGENWETIEIVETSEGTYEYTYSNLTNDTTYYVRVVVADEAGNSGASEAEEVTLGEVPGGDDDSGIYDEDGVSIPTVTFEYSTTDWTNEDVTVTVVVNGDSANLVEDGTYTIEYNISDPTDESSWIEYTEAVVFETNGSIYARLSDGTNTGDYATGTVNNIDKTAPTVVINSSTSNSIEVTAKDYRDTETEGLSGIAGYYISTTSEEPTNENQWYSLPSEFILQPEVISYVDLDSYKTISYTSAYSYVFELDGLVQNTTYYIWAIDNAGNISSLDEDSYTTTSSVPDLTDDIVEFTQSEDDWTNEDVTVYVDITDEDIQEEIDDGTYILEYSTDGGETWEEYDPEEGITVDENTEIEVRLSDGENTGGVVTHEVDNIDKTAPEVEIEVTDTTTNSITVEVTAEDLGDDGTSDSASGISSYEFQISTDGEDWETIEIVETSEETYEYTYSNLTNDTTYYVRVVVADEAGNSGASEAEEVTLGEVPGGDGDSGIYDEDGISIPIVTFEYSTTDWTNEDVTVTVVVNGDTADLVEAGTYIVEYNTSDPTDESSWIEYTEAVVFETNGSIYARLSDGTNTGDYATGTVANIDKIAPTVAIDASTSNSITVTIGDYRSESTEGLSGVTGYYISTSTEEPNEETSWIQPPEDAELWVQSNTLVDYLTGTGYTIVIEDLAQNTTYYIWAIDNAGNISSLDDDSSYTTTSSVPDLTDDSTFFEQSPDDWTNLNVVVYINLPGLDIDDELDDGTYIIEYSTDGGETWEEYDSETGIIVDENTEIEVRLTDGTNTGGSVTYEVDNIDKTAPEVELEVTDTTTNSITVEITAEDLGDDGTSYSSSGISSYEFQISTDGENWETVEVVETSDGTYEYTYSDLTDGTTYYVRVIVTDGAGNSGTSEAEEVSLEEVPGGDDDSGIYDEDGVSIPTVTFEYSTTEWTNEDVTVTVVVNGDTADLVEAGTYTIEYNISDPTDESSWIEYTEAVVFETNGSIYARLSDGTNTGDYATGTVGNIDKTAPQTWIADQITPYPTITVEVADYRDDLTEGLSDIYGYYISTSSESPDSEDDWIDIPDQTDTSSSVEDYRLSYIFDISGVEQTTTYYLWAMDNAGNISSLLEYSYITTLSMPNLSDYDVEFLEYPDDWTNEDVVVYVNILDEDIQEDINDVIYIIEYSTDGGETWEEYDPEEGITVDENTEIKVRLTAGYWTGGEVTHEVDNIDKTAPEVEIEVTDSTTNSITVEVTAEDMGDDRTSDSSSGIASYEFQISTDGEDWETIEIVETSEETYEYTYSNLTNDTTYYVRVVVADEAGNSGASEAEEVTLEEVPGGDDDSGLYDGDGVSIPTVTFEYSTTEWTNEDVTVTVVVNGDAADLVEDGTYTIEYNTDDPTDETSWTEYTEAVVFETNGSIYARLSDGTNTGDYATGTVNNIDKDAPTVTIEAVSTGSITVSINEEGSDVAGYYISTSLMTSTEDVEWIELSEDYLAGSSSSIGDADLEWWAYNYLFDIDELTQNTTYYIWAIDNAGNVSSLDDDSSYTTTSSVPDLTEYNVEFTQSTDDWTNESVMVYVNITDEDIQEAIDDGTYILEYLIYENYGVETWEEYDPDEGITVVFNTEIKVRLSDGTNTGEEVAHDIDNIDCTEPEVELEVTDSTTNSITVEVTAEDMGDDGTSDSSSGIASYEFQISTDGEDWETIEIVETSEETYEYTYEDLTDGTTYYVRVVVTDVAGNSTASNEEEVIGKITITVTKVWDDSDDADGMRPDSVSVYLYQDGELYSDAPIIISEDTDWIGTFDNVPISSKDEDGNEFEYAYAVAEDEVAGYEANCSEVTENSITITNTLEVSSEGAPTISGDISISYSTTDWTNEDVTVTATTTSSYTLQYTTDDPTNDSAEWTTGSSYEMTTNGNVYFRLTNGTDVSSFYATGTVGNIDKLEPTVTIESTEVGTTTEVTITGTATDSEATDEYDCSGIDVVYVGVIAEYEDLQTYYNDDGDPVYYDEDDIEWLEATVDEDGNFEYTFETEYEEIIAETAYVIGAKALDNASNESDIAESDVAGTEGDYVDYSATYEVIEDGDSTNDWRLFFITEEEYTSVYGDETISSATCTYDDAGALVGFTTTADNQVYIIASDYILADNMPTSTSGTSVKYSDDYPYGLYFYNIYSEYTGTADWDSEVDIWNSYYLNNYSSTYANAKAVEYLLDTSAWGEFYLDTEYGNYVIGSPTLEMWIAAWNSKGYSTLYCDKVGSYGYYVSVDESSYSCLEYVTSSYIGNSGYNDTIFFSHQIDSPITIGTSSGTCTGCLLASPSGFNEVSYLRVRYDGAIYGENSTGVSGTGPNNYSVRPVVAISSGVTGVYDKITGIWTLSEVAVDELTEASITLSYSTTEETTDPVTVTATTNTSYTLQYSLDLETWYDGDSYDMTENGYIYFRLTDGDEVSSFYATGSVTNIYTCADLTITLNSNGYNIDGDVSFVFYIDIMEGFIDVNTSSSDDELGVITTGSYTFTLSLDSSITFYNLPEETSFTLLGTIDSNGDYSWTYGEWEDSSIGIRGPSPRAIWLKPNDDLGR